jgi:uncharacterized protein
VAEHGGLTLRSRRGPTASRQAREAVGHIILLAGLAPCRRSRLTSNVRRRESPLAGRAPADRAQLAAESWNLPKAQNCGMDQYIYRIHPTRLEMLTQGPTEREARIVGEHFAYLSRLTEEGRLFMAGRTLTNDANTFGIAVFVASSPQEANAVLAEDPAIVQGVMRGEVFPFKVALWSGNPLAANSDA